MLNLFGGIPNNFRGSGLIRPKNFSLNQDNRTVIAAENASRLGLFGCENFQTKVYFTSIFNVGNERTVAAIVSRRTHVQISLTSYIR